MHFETNLLWQTHLGPNLTKLQEKPIIDVLESLVAQLTIILLAVEVLGWGSPGRANPGGQETATLPMSSWQSPWVMKNTFLSWGWTRRTFQSFPEPHGSCWVEKLEDKMEKFGDQKKKNLKTWRKNLETRRSVGCSGQQRGEANVIFQEWRETQVPFQVEWRTLGAETGKRNGRGGVKSAGESGNSSSTTEKIKNLIWDFWEGSFSSSTLLCIIAMESGYNSINGWSSLSVWGSWVGLVWVATKEPRPLTLTWQSQEGYQCSGKSAWIQLQP